MNYISRARPLKSVTSLLRRFLSFAGEDVPDDCRSLSKAWTRRYSMGLRRGGFYWTTENLTIPGIK